MDVGVDLLLDYSPQGLIVILLYIGMQISKKVEDLKDSLDDLSYEAEKQTEISRRYRERVTATTAESNSVYHAQLMKTETLLNIIHSEAKK